VALQFLGEGIFVNVLPAGETPLLSTVYPFLERFFPELAVFPELLMHSVRTAKYAFRLSCLLGLGRPRLLFWAGALHDAGKLLVPRHILEKPGPLLESEWKMIVRHPLWSFELVESRCRGVRGLGGILAAVKAHHESWDGTGYPEGLKGNGIPLEARILALADEFDALTSPRPYRSPLSSGEALKVMAEMGGKKLDPHLFQRARAFLARFKEEAV
jgi:HD-GYP domain-containing protein (c-di-GMP phosphodiesterase class II)